MSDITIEIIEREVLVEVVTPELTLSFPPAFPGQDGAGTLVSILGFLDELPVFDSDENANLGVDINGDAASPVNGWYMKSSNHVEGGGGSPKKML